MALLCRPFAYTRTHDQPHRETDRPRHCYEHRCQQPVPAAPLGVALGPDRTDRIKQEKTQTYDAESETDFRGEHGELR